MSKVSADEVLVVFERAIYSVSSVPADMDGVQHLDPSHDVWTPIVSSVFAVVTHGMTLAKTYAMLSSGSTTTTNTAPTSRDVALLMMSSLAAHTLSDTIMACGRKDAAEGFPKTALLADERGREHVCTLMSSVLGAVDFQFTSDHYDPAWVAPLVPPTSPPPAIAVEPPKTKKVVRRSVVKVKKVRRRSPSATPRGGGSDVGHSGEELTQRRGDEAPSPAVSNHDVAEGAVDADGHHHAGDFELDPDAKKDVTVKETTVSVPSAPTTMAPEDSEQQPQLDAADVCLSVVHDGTTQPLQQLGKYNIASSGEVVFAAEQSRAMTIVGHFLVLSRSSVLVTGSLRRNGEDQHQAYSYCRADDDIVLKSGERLTIRGPAVPDKHAQPSSVAHIDEGDTVMELRGWSGEARDLQASVEKVFPNATALHLSSSSITERMLSKLTRQWSCPRLAVLDLSGTRLQDDGIAALCTKLECPLLLSLNLSNVRMSLPGGQSLLKRLASLRGLLHLDVSCNSLGNAFLVGVATHPTLEVVNMWRNHVTGPGYAEYLKCRHRRESLVLNLAENRVDPFVLVPDGPHKQKELFVADVPHEVVEVHENQRYHVLRGWLHPNLPWDPAPWTLPDGTATRSKESAHATSPGYQYLEGWYLDGGDEDGWEYARTFLWKEGMPVTGVHVAWSPHAFSSAFCRRRVWRRRAIGGVQ